jgi:N-ethylmaleimide reductase
MTTSTPTTTLFTPARLGAMTLPNRVVMAPMSRVRAAEGGLATPSMATYYAERATAGLIITEGVQPSRVGQSNPGTPGLHTDAQAASWRPVTDAVHAAGGRIVAQLMHGGRVSHPDTTGHHPVAPSAVAAPGQVFTPTGPQAPPVPRALATDEVAEHVRSYADAARRAVEAGFDGVELHGANGYLISQFLSTSANLRTDRYGGSVANRIRFAVEAVTATAEAVGAERTGIRLSPDSGIWGAHDADADELYPALLAELAPLGLAHVHLAAPGEDLMAALRAVRPGTLIVNPTGSLEGPWSDRAAAERWLARGADLISFGRAFISNPDLVDRMQRGLPLTDHDPGHWYTGGDVGYLGFPSHRDGGR